ncbi:MAG: nitroreductase family protein [Desulfobacterales bacterium]|nr:nitroreductase family protein [Desulfobacterales bacterium]
MNDLFEIICKRRSIRKFTNEAPKPEILQELVKYAAMAPNAMNRQDWQFTITLSPEIRKKIYNAVWEKWENICQEQTGTNEAIKAYMGNFSSFVNAPALIAVDVRRPPAFLSHLLQEKAGSVMGNTASACMAVQNLVLAASAKGLGTCVYTGCNAAEKEIAAILEISQKRELVCLVAVGYPAEIPRSPGRKELEKIIRIK